MRFLVWLYEWFSGESEDSPAVLVCSHEYDLCETCEDITVCTHEHNGKKVTDVIQSNNGKKVILNPATQLEFDETISIRSEKSLKLHRRLDVLNNRLDNKIKLKNGG